ncbi:MAG TPA: DUF2791 family P-loop domain-containing protein [Aggregatilineales bacterium]|nr:DUF2791 family P-loop domain-containing protein [Anaerolineales bacterium]HRE48535.1 DUF2791 family P-loop domain-containing protein [Aggregatilineales bacterium]
MTTARRVKHPTLGEGILLKSIMGGYIWEVKFASGQRYRLHSHEFEAESIHAHIPTHNGYHPVPPPPQTDQFLNRQTLEALRAGVVPIKQVKDLTIGLEAEQTSLDRAIARALEHGGEAMAVIADYGFGKSHFVELTAQKALEKNFLVANTSLDLVEVPPGKAREIYRSLIASLRYPDHDEGGLKPLLQKALESPHQLGAFVNRSPIDDCPLCLALESLSLCDNAQAAEDIAYWLSAQIKPTAAMRQFFKKPPPLYVNGEVARQYAYLLTAISALAASLGYAGLVVLIDESEHYSLLKTAQRERADAFFKALIHAAMGPSASLIDPETIPNHLRADYPVNFTDDAHLLFLFASTESESRMPVEVWLTPSQVVRLDNRFLKEDIDKFLKMVLRYHSVAFDYRNPSKERYQNLLRETSALLSRSLKNRQINIRELIRLAVTICDLMYVHQDYDPNRLQRELEKGLA